MQNIKSRRAAAYQPLQGEDDSEAERAPPPKAFSLINSQLRALSTIGFAFAIIELLMVFVLVIVMASLRDNVISSDHLLVQVHYFHHDSFTPLQVARHGPRISLTILFLIGLLLGASIKLKIAIDALSFLISNSMAGMDPAILSHLIIQRVHYQTVLGSSLTSTLFSLPVLLCAGYGQLTWIIPAFFVTLVGRLLLLAFTQTRILHGILTQKGLRFTRFLYSLPLYLCEAICLVGGLAGGSFPWILGLYASTNASVPEDGSNGRLLSFVLLYSTIGLLLAMCHMIPSVVPMGPGRGWFMAHILDTVIITLYEALFFILVVRELYTSDVFNPALAVEVQ